MDIRKKQRAVVEALANRGAELALVTGNLEAIGRAKVASAGLGDLFADGRGGFGSDSEVRADLVGLARDRAALGMTDDGPAWTDAMDDPALSRRVLGLGPA